ncbi:MAG: sialidase family protein [Planctomycetota bacterium]|nr:sialidase family protein [Planctomycetota bacterium]
MRWLPLLAVLLAACGGGDGQPPPPAGSGETRLNTDGAGVDLSFGPEICCDGLRTYVVWYDRRNENLDIYFNRSLDGGVTWLEEDVRLDTDLPGAAISNIPRICCSGDAVYVVWYDERSGEPDIHFNRSLDAGATWLAQDVRLDTDLPGVAASREPVICCAGSKVYVAWSDKRDGTWDIRFNRSLDGGSSWLPDDVRIDTDPGTLPTDGAEEPVICCAGDAVYVAWIGDAGGTGAGVRFAASLDAGTTWPQAETPVSDAAAFAFRPRMACSGSNVYVVWTDIRVGIPHVVFNRSLDGGASWLPDDRQIDDGVTAARWPHLCAEGLRAYVVWSDERHSPPPFPEFQPTTDVYFDCTEDGGTTWLPAQRRLGDDVPGADYSSVPRICCSGPDLHVTWTDDLNGSADVLLTHSPDGGGTWLRPVVRMDGDPPGVSASLAPRLCCDGPFAVVVWYDFRDGPADIYARTADFSDPLDEP